MAQVQANGITLEYDERGSGEPILLVMGLGAQMTAWRDDFCDQLAERGHRVIRFDNRDIGLSTEFDWEPPSQRRALAAHLARRPLKGVGYFLSDMAADAAGLLDALGIESAHVVGASMGGMIAQTLAFEHPGKVRSLCSIMSNTGDRRSGRISGRLAARLLRLGEPTRDTALDLGVEMARLISGPAFDADETREFLATDLQRSWRPAGVARQSAAIAASPDRTPALRNLTVPTLVVHGLLDELVLPSGGIATAKAIPGSRLLMFPDMSHDLPRTRWAETLDAIATNAARATAGASPAAAA